MSHSREAVRAVVTLEFPAVDNGTIGSPPAIGAIREAGLAARIVRLKRNCGHRTAAWVGLTVAAADPRAAGAVVMDSDGEDGRRISRSRSRRSSPIC